MLVFCRDRNGWHGISAAMVTNLSALFAPSDEAKFLDCFARKEFSLFAGNAEAIGQLLSIDEIERLLANGTLRSPQVRLTRSGVIVPNFMWSTDNDSVDMPALHSLMNTGATLVVDYLGPLIPQLLELEHAIERRLGSRTLVNAYLTFKKGGAFAAHYDHHDVLIVQILGNKVWEILAPIENPASSFRKWKSSLPSPNDVFLKRDLRAGEMMFIPRGTWHRASVDDGQLSLHLTVTIISDTGQDYARWIVDQFEDDDLICTDIPRLGGGDAVQRYERALRDRMISLIESNDLAQFLAARDGERVPVSAIRLAAAFAPEPMDLVIPSMRRRLQPDPGDAGGSEVRAGGQAHRLTKPMRAALLAVEKAETGVAYGELLRALSDQWPIDIVEDAVRKLNAKGLVAFRSDRRGMRKRNQPQSRKPA